MPEETMRYRVELDASDLAPQLEAIRNQIDSAIGSAAAFQSPPAGIANFQQMTDFVAGGAGFGSTDVVSAANSAVLRTANFIDQAANRAQLGFSRFVGDARRLGLLSSSQYPSFEPMLSSAEAQLNPGITGNLGGFMFGLGFDPRGTLSMGTFRELSAETFSRTAGNFVAGSPIALAGLAFGAVGGSLGLLGGSLGAAAGPLGAVAGGVLGFAADIGYNVLAGRAQEQNEVARGLQGIADRTFGGMSTAAAREMAGELQDRAYSYQGRLRDFDMQDIQETMLTFGNAGGFGGIQNPQEFAQRTREVLDNVRLVAHSLNVFQEEAAQIMGELQQRGVTSLAGMGSFASTQQAMGGVLGMTGMGFIQLGLQGAQMVQGAGIGAATGFNVMQQAAMGINRAQADPFTRAIVADMGGAQAATATMAENVFRQMQSGMGFMQTMNVLGGGSVFAGGPGEIFRGAANYMGADPSNYFRALNLQGATNAAILGQTGFEGQQVQMVANAFQMMQDMGLAGDTIDDVALAGFMQLRYQIDSNTASMLVQTVAGGPEAFREQQSSAWVASVQNILHEQETTGLQRLGAGIAAGLLENTFARNIRGAIGGT